MLNGGSQLQDLPLNSRKLQWLQQGVFLVIRQILLYSLDAVQGVLLYSALGTFVAFYAASMALVNRDLKRIIAYSTLSQLGICLQQLDLGLTGLHYST